MKPSGYFLWNALLASALLLPAFSAFAATLSGTVSDTEGAIVAGAQIIAQQQETDYSITVISEEDGSYLFESLLPGFYTLTVRKSGYADLMLEKVAAGTEIESETVRLDLQLQLIQERTLVRGEEELNPNVFVVKLDTNEIVRQLVRRGARLQLTREFRSQENSYGATYGFPLRRIEFSRPRALLAGFHGSVYEYHQSSALNARSFFTVGKLKPSRRNQYGATFGGPLFSDKLSFNSAWSQLRESGFVNGNIQVPKKEERTPLSQDPEVKAMIARLLEGFPQDPPNLPHLSPRHLNTNAVRDIRNTAFSTRIDYQPRQSDQLAFEQRFLDFTEEPFEMVAGQNPVTFLRPQSYHLSYLRASSPRTIARFSFNFDRLAALLDVTERYKTLLAPLGVDVVPNIGLGGDFTGLGPGSSFPRRRVENRFHLSSELTHVRGNHTISLGFKLTRFQLNDLESDGARGSLSFQRNFGRGAAENFLLGVPSRFEVTLGDLYRGFRNWEDAFYFHDTIRVSPHWTLSVGLRHEILTLPKEVNNLTKISYRTDANNLAPQFGFAWNPGGGKAVLRGGYGITFGTLFPLLYQRERFNPPAVRTVTVNDPDLLDPLSRVELTSDGTERSELKRNSPDLVAPYTHLYTLSLERELPANTSLTVGYIGERTFKLPERVISNRAKPVPGIATTTKTINNRRPDPRFLQIGTVVNSTISYLDALHVTVNRRLSRGLALNAQYTFSKVISTGSTVFADSFTSAVSQSDEIMSDMKAVAKFDTPHAFTIGYSFELPGLRLGQGIQSLLLRGWRISGTTTFRSGTPLTVFTGSDSPGLGNVDGAGSPDRPNLLNPAILGRSIDHPDTAAAVLGADSCNKDIRPVQCVYFDTNLPPGGRGNIGFNTFRNDGTHNWNFALEKEFFLGKTGDGAPNLQLRTEFINLLNQPQFSPVNSRISADTFGQITNTANKGRVIQLMLRLRM